jgi:predicted transcriptional regulator with HTH domain
MGVNRTTDVGFLRRKQVKLFLFLEGRQLKGACDKAGISYIYALRMAKSWEDAGLIAVSRKNANNVFTYTEQGKRFVELLKRYLDMAGEFDG